MFRLARVWRLKTFQYGSVSITSRQYCGVNSDVVDYSLSYTYWDFRAKNQWNKFHPWSDGFCLVKNIVRPITGHGRLFVTSEENRSIIQLYYAIWNKFILHNDFFCVVFFWNLSTYKINKLLHGWFVCPIFLHSLWGVAELTRSFTPLATREEKSSALTNHEVTSISLKVFRKLRTSFLQFGNVWSSLPNPSTPKWSNITFFTRYLHIVNREQVMRIKNIIK